MWSQTVKQRKSKTTAINQGNANELLTYLVPVCTRTQQNKPDHKKALKRQKADRSSDECDARRSERPPRTSHVLKRTDNCRTGETTRRRGRRYRRRAVEDIKQLKPTGVVNNVMRECLKGCKKNISATHVAGTPPFHNVSIKKILVETLNNVRHPTRCPQPLNSVRQMVSYIVQCLRNVFFKPTLCKKGGPGHLCKEKYTTAARTKQHEDDEEDTRIKPAGREK